MISVNSEESSQEALQTQLYSLINTNLQTKSFHTRQYITSLLQPIGTFIYNSIKWLKRLDIRN